MPEQQPSTKGVRIGLDLGASYGKLVLIDAGGRLVERYRAPSRGGAPRAAAELVEEALGALGSAGVAHIGLTGGAAAALGAPPPSGKILAARQVNEVLAAARGSLFLIPRARTVIDLGGQLSKWILLGSRGEGDGLVIDFATNGLCAAGSGAFLEQQADRLGLEVEQLARLAAAAGRGASIAGRCSVFAKSDMIHLQQKGTPFEEIAYGLCLALARTFRSSVIGNHTVSPPVVLVGGGAANPGLVRAFGEILSLEEGQLVAPAEAPFAGALGAALLAGQEVVSVGDLRRAAKAWRKGAGEHRIQPESSLPALEASPVDREPPVERPPVDLSREVRAYLGVDVGSVSTNLVLVDPEMKLLDGIYLATRGRPVDVLAEGLDQISRRFGDRLKILGVGTTGSGRHLAAEVLGGDIVRNEITAQMVSAAHFVPEVDTIFEIGGQDSKFIAVENGRLADFEMNKICAAGTGSFLEEQAGRLGLSIIGEFADKALAATAPADLGSRCTVFMDTELVRGFEAGVAVEDLCAGLAFSVCRNYLEKVVAGRRVGDHIVFQGGTASNKAVVAALRRLLGREVTVHPYNRLSGAIGAAILAAEEQVDTGYETRFRGIDACAGAEISSFECGRCENLCEVNRVRVQGRVVHFGDTCERYSEKDRESGGVSRPFPELFAARQELFEEFVARTRAAAPAEGERIGLLLSSLNLDLLPLWTSFLAQLGYRTVLSPKTASRLLKDHPPLVPGDVCLPIKVASSQAQQMLSTGSVERIFVPAVIEHPAGRGGDEHTCLFSQQLADMLRISHGKSIVSAQFGFSEGVLGLADPALALAQVLDRGVEQTLLALRRALALQHEFERARERLGAKALEADFQRAVVVLGKPYNVHDPFLNLSLARLLDRLGLPAIPWDLLPLADVELDKRWDAVPWHYNRQQLRALEIVRKDERLHPLLVSSYGCGPDAFTVKHLEQMLGEVPRLLLEFDEHRGEAGLQTRLEAFADEIETHERQGGPAGRRWGKPTRGSTDKPRGRRFLVPDFGPHSSLFVAILRAGGWEAEVLPQVDEETVRLGEENATGHECHPHIILIGELCRLPQTIDLRAGDIFLSPQAETACLIRQYGDSLRFARERCGVDVEVWDGAMRDLRGIVGPANMIRLYEGLLATDILLTLFIRLRPYVHDQSRFEEEFDAGMRAVTRALESRESCGAALARAADILCGAPRHGEPGDRPVVGITGDLYTRIHPMGNDGLFRQLEEAGCEVWPSPFFAEMTDLSCQLSVSRQMRRGEMARAAGNFLTGTLTGRARRKLVSSLPEAVREWAVEPPAERIRELAAPYTGCQTNYLILHCVAKLADFLSRGADGALSVAGINCMVGTAIAATIPAIREDFSRSPVMAIAYGGAAGPSQRIRLETFIEQVFASHRGRVAGGDRLAGDSA